MAAPRSSEGGILARLAPALADALAGSDAVGVSVTDEDERFVYINEALASMNGRSVAEHLGRRVADVLPRVGPALSEHHLRALAGDPVLDVEVRAPFPDGRSYRASYLPLEVAGARYVAGIVLETTGPRDRDLALRLTEERLQLALERTGMGTWEWDVRRDEIRWSDNLGPLYGRPRGWSPGTIDAFAELVHPDDREDTLRRAMEAQEVPSTSWEFRAVLPTGEVRWIETRTHMITGDGGAPLAMVGLNTDVTERVRRESSARFVARASALLSEPLDLADMLRRLARLAVPSLADWVFVHLAGEDGGVTGFEVWSEDPAFVEHAWKLWRRWPPEPHYELGAPAVIRSGVAQVMTDLDDTQLGRIARDPEHLAALRALDIRSALVVPLVARGRTIGAMTFTFSTSGRRHTDGDLAVAEDLGRRAGLAVENVQLYERQREIALTLQRSLLPASLPAVPGLELGARYVAAAEQAEAGGDWYEAIVAPGGAVGLLVGDVVGHGVHAAAVMGQLRAAARAYALEGLGPADLLVRLSRYADSIEGALAATASYVLLDPVTGRARFASAGHPPPLVVPAAGAGGFADERAGGALLGVMGDACTEGELELGAGTALVLYSDGAVERRGRPIDEGMRALREATEAARDAGAGADELCARILAGLFARAAPDDDVVLLAARRAP